jgi:hypothetical protein
MPLLPKGSTYNGYDEGKLRELTQLLITHGADVNAKNIRENTAAYYLERHFNMADVADILLEPGKPGCHAIIRNIVQSTRNDLDWHIRVLTEKGPDFAPSLAESIEDEQIFLYLFDCLVEEDPEIFDNCLWITETFRKRYHALPPEVKQKEFNYSYLHSGPSTRIKTAIKLYLVGDYDLSELISEKKELERIMDNEDVSHGGETMGQRYCYYIYWINKRKNCQKPLDMHS